MLALLQPLRKQTRAPNDSNKPAAGFRSASRPAGAAGCYGRRSGGFGTPARLGVPGPPGGAVPAAARGEPARPRSARSELGCNSGTPSAPPGGQCKAPRPARPGGTQGKSCTGSPRRPAACIPLHSLAVVPLHCRAREEEKLIFTFVCFGGCNTQDTTLQSKFIFQRANIKLSLIEGWILQTTLRIFSKYSLECLGRL